MTHSDPGDPASRTDRMKPAFERSPTGPRPAWLVLLAPLALAIGILSAKALHPYGLAVIADAAGAVQPAHPAAVAQATESFVHLPILLRAAFPDPPTPFASPSALATSSATPVTTPLMTPVTTPGIPPATPPVPPDFVPFGLVRLDPELVLEGGGTTIDSLAFWEAPDAADSLLLVTAKGNQRVEVWQQPFQGRELPALQHPSFGSGTQVNGIVVDQDADRVYVAVSRPASTVAVFALPALTFLGEIVANGVDLRTEPNLALLTLPDGGKRLYVSADDRIYGYDPDSGAAVSSFMPARSLETLLADDLEQVLYAPDEVGRSGIYAYRPDGSPFSRGGHTRFGGDGIFEADAEGITLYACRTPDGRDDGRGLVIVSDQKGEATDFEVFDRRSWTHLGRFVLNGVRMTDGIASTQQRLPGHSGGLFAAVNHDTAVVLVGWEIILAATGVHCESRSTAANPARLPAVEPSKAHGPQLGEPR